MLVGERYRLGEPLGRGGMGEVFRAVDEVLGRPVAVKLLRPTDRDPAAAERFRREARSAAILNDTHVVAVYDFGQHGDRAYLVMELVEGGSVAEELARTGPVSRDRAIDIIEQTAAGLAAAHRQDIVHRDIKPGNLLLATDGTVKIADFGIAHLADEGAATLTATGQIVGSTHYLAPERAQGRPAGKASDVYALGCVLYQLVVGHPPFTAEHPTAILYQHVDTDPVPPSQQQPELGGAFEALLLRMLAKDPAARPTATEIAGGALRAPAPVESTPTGAAALGAEGSTLTDQAVPAPTDLPADSAAGVTEGGSGTGALAGRRKYVVAGAAALLATAAAVAAAVLIDGNETQPPATINLDPKPSVAPSTPGRTPKPTGTQPSNQTQPGAVNQTTPVRSPSQQGTPSPGTSPSSTPTSSPSTPSPSTPTQSSDTPSAPPTSNTPPPEPSPSPSSKPSTSGTPSVAPPTPAENGVNPVPGTD